MPRTLRGGGGPALPDQLLACQALRAARWLRRREGRRSVGKARKLQRPSRRWPADGAEAARSLACMARGPSRRLAHATAGTRGLAGPIWSPAAAKFEVCVLDWSGAAGSALTSRTEPRPRKCHANGRGVGAVAVGVAAELRRSGRSRTPLGLGTDRCARPSRGWGQRWAQAKPGSGVTGTCSSSIEQRLSRAPSEAA